MKLNQTWIFHIRKNTKKKEKKISDIPNINGLLDTVLIHCINKKTVIRIFIM